MLTGIVRTFDIAVTQEQLNTYAQGELAQNAFPNLSENDREFIMTGITAEEWETLGHKD